MNQCEVHYDTVLNLESEISPSLERNTTNRTDHYSDTTELGIYLNEFLQ